MDLGKGWRGHDMNYFHGVEAGRKSIGKRIGVHEISTHGFVKKLFMV